MFPDSPENLVDCLWLLQVVTHPGISEQETGEVVAKLEPSGAISHLSQTEHDNQQVGRSFFGYNCHG